MLDQSTTNGNPRPGAPQAVAEHPHGFGLPVYVEGIPEATRSGCWCVWQATPKKGRPGKYDKIPRARGLQLSTRQPERWLTFEQAVAEYQAGDYNGVGKLVMPDEGLVYIDIDGDTDAPEWLARFPTYCERSPSGAGLRLIGCGNIPRDITRPIEVYGGHAPRFVTITGHCVADSPQEVADIAAPVTAYIEQHASASPEVERGTRPELLDPESIDRSRVPPGVAEVLGHGFVLGADRSAELMTMANQLARVGYDGAQVLTLLAESEHVLGMALEHRHDDYEKALDYLWSTTEKALAHVAPEPDAKDLFEPIATPAPATLQLQGHPLADVQPEDLRITLGDTRGIPHHPPMLVNRYLYQQVRVVGAAGGVGKTTLSLAEALYAALGRPLFGVVPVAQPYGTLIVTAEDSRLEMLGRLSLLAKGMGLCDAEFSEALGRIFILDVVATLLPQFRRLVAANHGALMPTTLVDELGGLATRLGAKHVVIDPLVSFGADEERVNTNAQALIEAARQLMKAGLAVTLVHHVGQSNAREKAEDQYGLRGGTALSDGARVIHIINPFDSGDKAIPGAVRDALHPTTTLARMVTAKLTYDRKPEPLWLLRDGWRFRGIYAEADDPEAQARAVAQADDEKVLRFLTKLVREGRQPTGNELARGYAAEIGLSKNRVEDAMRRLRVEGRVVDVARGDTGRGGPRSWVRPAEVQPDA